MTLPADRWLPRNYVASRPVLTVSDGEEPQDGKSLLPTWFREARWCCDICGYRSATRNHELCEAKERLKSAR